MLPGFAAVFQGTQSLKFPGAAATYADFVSATGAVIGSYVDSDGIYHGYVRAPDGRFIFGDVLEVSNLEYFFCTRGQRCGGRRGSSQSRGGHSAYLCRQIRPDT